MFIVTLREGTLCQAAGLAVEFCGHNAHVRTNSALDREVFWAVRLDFLRSNPRAE